MPNFFAISIIFLNLFITINIEKKWASGQRSLKPLKFQRLQPAQFSKKSGQKPRKSGLNIKNRPNAAARTVPDTRPNPLKLTICPVSSHKSGRDLASFSHLSDEMTSCFKNPIILTIVSKYDFSLIGETYSN